MADRGSPESPRGRLVEVAVALPVAGTFHYLAPAPLDGRVAPGHRVLVPFGRRRVTGYVVGLPDSAAVRPGALKPVLALLDETPLVPPPLLDLLRWVADYYLAPLGEVFRTALPGGLAPASVRRLVLTPAGLAAARALELGELGDAAAAGGPGAGAEERAAPMRPREKPAASGSDSGRRADGAHHRDEGRGAAPGYAAPDLGGPETDRDHCGQVVEAAARRPVRGEEAGSAAGLSPAEARLLARLARAGEGLLPRTLLAGGGPAAPRALASLRRRGLVAEAEGLGGDRARPRRETVVRLAAGLDEPALAQLARRAPRRAAVLRCLRDRGAVPLSDLRRMLGDVGSSLRALAAEGRVTLETIEVSRRVDWGLGPAAGGDAPLALTPAQVSALEAITAALGAGAFASFLLHGVTGSGKTEVYLRAIETALAAGRGAIVLVPEISLTPQLVARFRRRLGDRVAVLHSGLSDGERYDEWRRILGGEARVVVGARSAVFAPVVPLGIVVVDEEQEGSFKQEDGVRYHARDVALVRARQSGAVCVLGSATPSLESWARATGRLDGPEAGGGRHGYLPLPDRVEARLLPAVEIVDLRRRLDAWPAMAGAARAERGGGGAADGRPSAPDPGAAGEPAGAEPGSPAASPGASPRPASPRDRREEARPPAPVSTRLEGAIEETLAAGRQALLFLNRRGYATFLLCPDCGYRFGCRDCSVALVYHRAERALRCHYCGASRPAPALCPKCGGADVLQFGSGTERVEEWLAARFPRARIARLDRDAVGAKGAVRDILAEVAEGRVDLLVGTQMVAKGHDFPGVTLVGVLLAESGLALPDFRAAERTFQLLTQVAGRAGRGEAPGRVIVQTYDPEHPAVRLAAAHDVEGFYVQELAARRELGYPPFRRLVNLRLDAPTAEGARRAAAAVAARVAARLAADRALAGQVEMLGPSPAPLSRLRGRHRWHLLLKGRASGPVRRLAAAVAAEAARPGRLPPGATLAIDVDPGSLL